MQSKHQQIRHWILTRIHDGRLPVGSKVPTEVELMETFNVSRNPVQKAMSDLVASGYLVRRRGYGTTVASAGFQSNVHRSMDSDLGVREFGHVHKVISTRTTSADACELSAGFIPDKTPVAEILRLKESEAHEPLALERCVIDLTVAPNILDADLSELVSLAYLAQQGVAVTRSTSTIRAMHLAKDEAQILDVTTLTPVIRQTRVSFGAENRVIEVSSYTFHPIRASLEVNQIE